MADPYIDQFETLIYGNFARAQMSEVCLGKIKKLDPMVHFAIEAQERADAEMKAVLDRQPRPAKTEGALARVAKPISRAPVLGTIRHTAASRGRVGFPLPRGPLR